MVTADYCHLLKRAGCYSVLTAIECGDEDMRSTLLNRKMTDEQILTACAHLREAGIKIYSLNMVGLPGETREHMLKTISLNRQAKVDYGEASIFQPYPGTRLTQFCKDHGYLDDQCDQYESQYTQSILKMDPILKNDVYVLHRLFSLLVDHKWLQTLLPVIRRVRPINGLLNLLFRFYYGALVHRRIYAGKIPLRLRIEGVVGMLLSRNRI